MTTAITTNQGTLLIRLGARCCAFRVENVVEIMRPLPIESIENMPAFVRGVATIRGSPVPVVDLAVLFGDHGDAPITRFVLLRLGERRAAVAVEHVIGVRHLDSSALQEFPPLLQDAYADLVAAIEIRDQHLLFVLQSSHILPDDVWQRLDASEVMS